MDPYSRSVDVTIARLSLGSGRAACQRRATEYDEP